MENKLESKDESKIRESMTTECIGYKIEGRFDHEPLKNVGYGGVLMTNKWKELPVDFTEDKKGVPSNFFTPVFSFHGYLSFEQAMAIAYGFISQAAASRDVGFEVRLVPHKLKSVFESRKQIELEPIKYNPW